MADSRSMSPASNCRPEPRGRDWAAVFNSLPPLNGQTVLDLGCGRGDLASEMTARGARVIGVDMNENLIREARSRGIANAEFRALDLRSESGFGLSADGLWCSFIAAYFPALSVAIRSWANSLRPGGWAALTEIDDLFGHEPLSDRTKSLLAAYARQALEANRYDFHMGHKLRHHLEDCGFTLMRVLTLSDRELSFDGPAPPDVIEAWRSRFDRMTLLRDFCGSDFESVREEFLVCLKRADHRSTARIVCCIANRAATPGG